MKQIEETHHIRSHAGVRVPGYQYWGKRTLCGLGVIYAPTRPYEGACRKCLRIFIMKKEIEIENFKAMLGAD